MTDILDVVNKFNTADNAIKSTFPKVDPRLIVSLIFDRNANKKNIYTLEIILQPGHDTVKVRQDVIDISGVAPAFYLHGTKMIVTHALDLEFLKWVNDQEGVVSIKGSQFSAGGSSDF